MNTKSWMQSALGLAVVINLVHCKDESPDPPEGGTTPGQGGMSGYPSPAIDASDARAASSDAGGAGGGGGTGRAGGPSEAGVVDAALHEAGADALADVSARVEGGGGPAIVDASDGAARDANVVATFQSVIGIFNSRCVSCHAPGDGAPSRFLDLQTSAGLYERLIAALPESQHGYCGVDGGVDGGGSAWRAVVPGNPAASLLYVKVAMTPPAACGARMPKVPGRSADGGVISVGCDVADGGASNCLNATEIETIRSWIAGNAPDR